MLSRCPVVDYQEGVDLLYHKIESFSGNKPYIVTIRGISGIGKSHFGRDVLQHFGYSRRGLLTKPHDLSREQYARNPLDFLLLEIDWVDNAYQDLIDLTVQKRYGKRCDSQIVLVHQLDPLVDSFQDLEKVLKYFDVVVENMEHPAYKNTSR